MFIKYSFNPEPDTSWLVMMHYSFMIYLKLRLLMHQDDLSILDKR